jgi:hypothetical protein
LSRLLRHGLFGGATFSQTGDGGFSLGLLGGGGGNVQGAGSAVQNHLAAILQCQRSLRNTANGRNTQRAGQNGHVAGGTAGTGAEAQYLARVQRGGVGRCQVFGNQDGTGGYVQLALLDASQQGQHAAAHVADVVGAFTQQGVVLRFQTGRVGTEGGTPGPGGGFAIGEARIGQGQQVRVLQQFLMHGQDGALGLVLQLGLDGFDLLSGFFGGAGEVLLFHHASGTGFHHVKFLQAVMENAANGDAGRGTHASQHASAVLLYRLGGGGAGAAGASSRLSPQRSSSSWDSSAMAAAASGRWR